MSADPLADRAAYLADYITNLDAALATLGAEMAARATPLQVCRDSAQAELDALTSAQEAVAEVAAENTTPVPVPVPPTPDVVP